MASVRVEPGEPGGPAAEAVDDLTAAVAALRDPTRRAILRRLHEEGSPKTVDEVAGAAGIHRTVAFEHLELLVKLGFLAVDRRRGGHGKPAKLYRPGSRAIQLQHPQRQFLVLAQLLAAAIAAGSDHAGLIQTAHQRGRELRAPGDGSGLPAAAAVLERLGGRPAIEGNILYARNCVFREACASAPQVVCTVQAAVLEGALTAAGTGGRLMTLGPDHGSGCRFQLARTA